MAYYWRQETCRLDMRELRFQGIFLIQAAACACVVCQLCGKEAPLCERNDRLCITLMTFKLSVICSETNLEIP